MRARPDRPLKVQALWARVDANRVRVSTFVVTFVFGSAVLLESAMVVLPGVLLSALATDVDAYMNALRWVVGASFIVLLAAGGLLAAVQLANAEDWVRARFKGRDLQPGEADGLLNAVADMALAAGLASPPRVIVIQAPDDSVNALAIGTTRTKPLIGVTPGFMRALSADEQRAVLATLVARIIAGDIMFGTALAALMGPIKAIRTMNRAAGGAAGSVADAGCSDPGCGDPGCGGCSDIDSDGCGGALGVVAFVVVVAVITYVAVVGAAWIVTIWGRVLHRTTYEKADAEGMLLLRDPTPMLSALSKASRSSNLVADGDASYDSIFYVATSGTPRVEKVERRRYDRLREVLGTDGIAADPLDH